jgi:hypothetical protein
MQSWSALLGTCVIQTAGSGVIERAIVNKTGHRSKRRERSLNADNAHAKR